MIVGGEWDNTNVDFILRRIDLAFGPIKAPSTPSELVAKPNSTVEAEYNLSFATSIRSL